MRISFTALLVASLALGACGSVLNPGNWFGRSTSEPIQQVNQAPANPLIPEKSSSIFKRKDNAEPVYVGQPFDEIIDLTIDRVPGGAIIRATGRADRQGSYAVQLTPLVEDETPINGVLTYRLEAVKPDQNTPIGTAPTREATAGREMTDQELRGVTTIRVEGVRNALVARR